MSDHAGDLDRYLRILAGASPAGRLIEIRAAIPDGMRQTFTPATRPDLAARTITRLAASTDVYVGVLLRRRRAGGRHACERSHLAFIETDDPSAIEQVKHFAHQPTMTISSSPGHLHLYWQLQQPVDLDELEQANRRLAHHLGGDLASVDAARILRPPTSWNRKRTPPTRVDLLAMQAIRRYQLTELTAGLADPSPPRQPTAPSNRPPTSELDRQLLAIPAATYVPALTGRQPNRAGKIRCPFHDDANPSFQLYDHGWYCFGACRTGGSIYDFAGLLYGLSSRGREFLQLRQRLAEDLLPLSVLSHLQGSWTP
ncbi:MAG: DNA-primase RepB domain-containing protein [Solirubrobacteraceae bacterium]